MLGTETAGDPDLVFDYVEPVPALVKNPCADSQMLMNLAKTIVSQVLSRGAAPIDDLIENESRKLNMLGKFGRRNKYKI